MFGKSPEEVVNPYIQGGEPLLVEVARIMSVRRILPLSLTVPVLAALLLLLPLTHASAQVAPSMGAAASFAVLGAEAVTNTGNSVIIGDVGVSPGTSITGFPPGFVVPPGTIHQTDTVAADAQGATTTAYNALTAQAPGTPAGPDLTGLNLVPGVYSVGAAATNLAGTLTLTGGAADVWIFLMSSTLITSSSSVVQIIGGSPCNVFWQVTSSATIGSGSTFLGNILALQSISLGNAASVSGRLLARTGAVTLINNKVDISPCAVPHITPGGTGFFKIFRPSIISPGGISTLTITFSNTDAGAALLLSDFTDTLPSGVVIADTPNVATTCGGSGAPTATPGGSTVTLPAGASIPGGSVLAPGVCTLKVDVTSQVLGSHVNTLDVTLHTDKGDSRLTTPAGATLRVSSTPPLAVGGEMLTIDRVRMLLPWFGLIMIFTVVAVQTLVIRRRNKAD